MSFESQRAAIATYINTGWNASAYPLLYENQPTAQPLGRAWARMAIRPADSRSLDIGSTMKRVVGVVMFQFFLPESTGTADSQKMADAAATLLDEHWLIPSTGGVIRFRRGAPSYVGNDGSGFEQWSWKVPYEADE